jgi:arylsulfatase A-like enzyme
VREFKWLVVLLLPLLFVPGCGGQRGHEGPDNVILISIDTLRADRVGCYGYERPTSPTLDALAAEGALFENAVAPSPWTLPSHMSLLTGLYPSRHGVKTSSLKLPSNTPTLATVLSEHGLATGAVVNSIYLDEIYGPHRGFDYYGWIPDTDAPEGAATEITDDAIRWIGENAGVRFFFFLHYFDVHSDYASLPRYEEMFVDPAYKGSASGKTVQLLQFKRDIGKLKDSDRRHLSDLYDAGIRQLDDELNRFFAFLKTRGLWDNTLIIVVSDHGEEFFDHGDLMHGHTQFEEQVHVPLIVRGPGLAGATRFHDIVSLVDIMPSILGVLGVTTEAEQDGVDLRLAQRSAGYAPAGRVVFAEAAQTSSANSAGDRAVRNQRYKLHYDTRTGVKILFDLQEDPGEQKNIAAETPTVVDSLFNYLEHFMLIDRVGERMGALSTEQLKRLRALGYLQ